MKAAYILDSDMQQLKLCLALKKKCELFDVLLPKCSEYTTVITLDQSIPEIHKASKGNIKESLLAIK